ncbi:hypothetical protein A33M_0074 [Rhodovulum sp. PH10]|nr:hypothetical protein A33M_0074 [Rhodovulum sp. PH10]
MPERSHRRDPRNPARRGRQPERHRAGRLHESSPKRTGVSVSRHRSPVVVRHGRAGELWNACNHPFSTRFFGRCR